MQGEDSQSGRMLGGLSVMRLDPQRPCHHSRSQAQLSCDTMQTPNIWRLGRNITERANSIIKAYWTWAYFELNMKKHTDKLGEGRTFLLTVSNVSLPLTGAVGAFVQVDLLNFIA